ncbi:MAG: glycoside hydrolase family 97 C-terminal domain-containing protein, partial [Prevotella sp.]|nr:glycoside hydrolase family 97 C-terminal domain-containing protein [Prevotella sp.]
WFVGNVAGQHNHISNLTLDFLDKGKKYVATIYSDAKDANYKTNTQAYTIKKGIVTSKTKLKLNSVIAGGYAISLIEVTNASQTKGLKNIKKYSNN